MSSREHIEGCLCPYCAKNDQAIPERIVFGKLDLKYTGIIMKGSSPGRSHEEIIPHDEWIIFRAKDDALEDTLIFYLGKIQELGADRETVDCVLELIGRLRTWRKANAHLCKTPDTKRSDLIYDALEQTWGQDGQGKEGKN